MSFVFEICPDGHRCNNGSKCIEVENDEGTFTCDCDAIQENVFAGLSCEHKATVFCNDRNVISRTSFCTNGGTCTELVSDKEAHFACACTAGYMGDHCEFTDGANLPNHALGDVSNSSGGSGGGGLSDGAVAVIVLIVLASVLGVGLFMIRKRLRQWDPTAPARGGKNDDIRAAPDLVLEPDGSVLSNAVKSGAGVNSSPNVYTNGGDVPADIGGGQPAIVSPTSVSSDMENGFASPPPVVSPMASPVNGEVAVNGTESTPMSVVTSSPAVSATPPPHTASPPVSAAAPPVVTSPVITSPVTAATPPAAPETPVVPPVSTPADDAAADNATAEAEDTGPTEPEIV